jgi:2-dehydropantoate 2-reductase
VLQDLLKGRLSEVEMINGMIAAESEKRGYAAPANARINAIVRRIEAGELKPGVENMELVGR